MQGRHDIKISAVIIRDGDHWIAQCLEYDICAQAKTLEDVHSRFARVIIANAAISIDMGHEPFAGIEPAPQRFWDMFSNAKFKVEADLEPIKMPHATLVPDIVPDYRMIEHTA